MEQNKFELENSVVEYIDVEIYMFIFYYFSQTRYRSSVSKSQ